VSKETSLEFLSCATRRSLVFVSSLLLPSAASKLALVCCSSEESAAFLLCACNIQRARRTSVSVRNTLGTHSSSKEEASERRSRKPQGVYRERRHVIIWRTECCDAENALHCFVHHGPTRNTLGTHSLMQRTCITLVCRAIMNNAKSNPVTGRLIDM